MEFKDLKLRNKYVLLIITLCFLLIFIYYYGNFLNYNLSKIIRNEFKPCIDSLIEGRDVYKNQAVCYHPPVSYFLLYEIQKISGNNFYLFTAIFIILLHVFSFYIIYKIIKKETNRNILFLPLIIYSFTSFVFGLKNFEVVLGCLFLLCGIYLLFYTTLKYKEFISGIFFTFSILTYQSYFLFFGIIILFYSIKNLELIEFKNKFIPKLNINKKIIKLFYLLSPFPILLFIFHLIFPEYFIHSFLLYIYALLFFSGSSEIFGFYDNFYLTRMLIFLLIFIASLIFIFWKRNLFSFLLLFYSLSMPFAFFGAGGYFKLVSLMPLFIILFIDWNYKPNKFFFWRIFFIFLIIILLFIGIKEVYLTHKFNDLNKEVGYSINLIPKQEGVILADKNRFNWYNYPYDYDIETVKAVGEYDRNSGPNLEKLGFVNLTEWQERELNREYEPIKQRVIGGKYSLLIVGEMEQREDVTQILFSIAPLLPITYCSILIPVVEFEGPNNKIMLTLFFKNFEDCEKIFEKMNVYYTEHFDSICKKDEFVANGFIKQTLHQNGFTINKSCNSDKEIIFSYFNKGIIGFNDFKIILLFFSFILFIYILKEKKRNKYILGLLLLLIIISIFSLVIQRNKDTPYRLAMEDMYYEDHFSFLTHGHRSFYPNKECVFVNIDGNKVSFGTRLNKICDDDDECIYFAKLMGYKSKELDDLKCFEYKIVECKDPNSCTFQFLN